MNGRPVTLRDVARAVGVSEATASAVLNATRSGTRVSPLTRDRLQEAARTLGYRPNELARALVRRRTRLLGFFAQFECLNAPNLFLTDLVGGLQEAAAEAGHDLVLHTIQSGSEVVRSLTDRRVDGLVFYAPQHPELIRELAASGLPIVNVVDATPLAPSVVADDAGGMTAMADHLAARGHRLVIYRDWHLDSTSVITRREAFLVRAKALGMEVGLGRRVTGEHDPAFSPDELALLRRGATALVAWEDTCAQLAAAELERLGYPVPERVAVTGFNGIPVPQPPRHVVTTVRAPWREVGRQGVRQLLRHLDGQTVELLVTLPTEFVPGATT